MTTAAFIGSQTLIQVSNGLVPETFITIGEVVSVSPIARKKDSLDVTHLESEAKEFIGGLPEGQDITIVCNNVPDNVEQVVLWAAAGTPSRTKKFKYVMPSTAAGGSQSSSFPAIVLSSSVGPTAPSAATQITFGLKIVGPITAFASEATGDDEEFMNPVLTDLTNEVTFPVGGGIGGDGTGPILAINFGKLLVLSLDVVLHVPAGLDSNSEEPFLIQLPVGFDARDTASAGRDYASHFYFSYGAVQNGWYPARLAIELPPVPSSTGSMFIQSRFGLDKLAMFFWNDQLKLNGGDVYVAGQISYVLN